MTTLSTGDRLLLRRVLSWARVNGWRREKPMRCRHDRRRLNDMIAWRSQHSLGALQLDIDDQPTAVLRLQRDAGWLDMWVSSTVETVDVLVALGVMPAELGSLYNRGWTDLEKAIRDNVIVPNVEEYFASWKAPVRKPSQELRRYGWSLGVEEVINDLSAELGDAPPLWEDMRAIATGGDS